MEDLIASLNKLTASVNVADTNLESCVKSKRDVEAAIKVVKDATSKVSDTDPNVAIKEAIVEAKAQAPIIYSREITDAISKSPEYEYPAFKSPLLDVGFNEDLYKITPIGAGWNTTVSVRLAMDEVAGTIDDYAEGVESARGALNVKEDRDPYTASKIWRTKIYKGPRYYTTIGLRLSAAAGVAPFWSLLNYGSKNVTMKSDLDPRGTPYLNRGGHHFVEHTEAAIKKVFLETLRKFKDAGKGSRVQAEAAIEEAKILLATLQTQVDMLSSNSDLMDKVAKELGVSKSRLNACKVLKYADMVKRGEHLPGQLDIGKGEDRIRPRDYAMARILAGG